MAFFYSIKRFVTIFSVLFLLLVHFDGRLLGQERSDSTELTFVSITHATGHKNTSLVLGGGFSSVSFRDDGTAPFAYKGMSLPLNLGIKWHGMRKFDFTISSSTLIGVCKQSMTQGFSLDAFDINNTIRLKLEKHFSDYSLGASITNFIDVTVNPDYENAAVGVSDFVGPELSVKYKKLLSTIFLHDFWNNKAFHGEFLFMPLAATIRPGYSYIDNYSASQPVLAAQFGWYEWHIQPFASISTDIGIDIYNDTHSRISLSYIWTFHLFDALKMHLDENYRDSAPFRHSFHLLSVDFLICLKTKEKCQSSFRQH